MIDTGSLNRDHVVMEFSRTALEHFRAGRIDEAEHASLKALRLRPQDGLALAVLGLVHNTRGAYTEAAQAFRRLTRLEPAQAAHWVNLGTAQRAAGELDHALTAYRRALSLGERGADLLFNLGLLHLDRAEYADAQRALTDAVAAAPRDAELRYHYARSCYDCVLNDEARAALRDWPALDGLNVELLTGIGSLLLQLGETGEAESALQLALQQDPGNVRVRLRLIQLAERNNRLEQARAELAALPAAAQQDELREDLLLTEALIAQRSGRNAEARDKYQALLDLARRPQARQTALFPLAKVYDALEQPALAFETLQQAHQAQLEFIAQSAQRFVEPRRDPMAIADYGSDAADVSRWDTAMPDAAHSPVFIVAFPRSGTTLLEQMLDAHPLLRSMDEQPFLQNAIDRMEGFGVRYPEQLGELGAEQLEQARQHYWSLVAGKLRLEPGQRLVDKNPLNLLRLPAIRRLFPQARILLAIRHPCDVLLSCYMQHFRAPDFALLCRDLPSLARGYRRAFDFWYQQAALLQPTCLEVRYESFVAEFDGQARAIAAFLQLPWDEAMLDPARHARQRGFISTPSYSQVVQPVNSRAVDRWRRYAGHFGEALAELEPYLRRWNYEA